MAPAVFAYDSRFVCILEKGMLSTSAMRLRTRAVAWCGTIIETSFESQPVYTENFPNTLGHRGCSLLVNRFSVHFEVGVPRVDREVVHALAVGEENA